MTKTIKKSDVVVLEIGNTGNQAELLKMLQLENGSCFDIFTPEQKDSVLTWGSGLLHITKEQFEALYSKQKPFALLQLDLLKMLQGSYKMYESEIQALATQNNIPVQGLETVAFQMSIFDSLPPAVVANMVMMQLRNPNESASVSAKLYQDYVNQDVEALFASTQDAEAATIEALVYQRNRNWIPFIGTYMQSKSCFFAVGAAHLGGENGVLNLLKLAGYEIIPIKL